MSGSYFRGKPFGFPPSVRIVIRSLNCEHQQKSDEEREDPQCFCECDADEQRSSLTGSSRWVTQCACEEVASYVTNTDRGSAGSDCSQASADVCEFAFHT